MTTSLRLILEDFLGLMREEGELDEFLPTLMSAMGHEVLYRAEKGPRQYGVDILSVGRDEDGKKTLFMWLVKCGNIGRGEWDSGPNSVRQSINDVGDTYLRSHVAPAHKALKKKLLIVTNGDFRPTITETIAGVLDKWMFDHGAEAEQVNGSTLAAWSETHLLNEYILSSTNRTLFRRLLANVSTPDLCVSVGRSLVDNMLNDATVASKSIPAARKRMLTGLRGVRTALQVLHLWASSEGNLLAPYLLSQYAVLSVWSHLHTQIEDELSPLAMEFASLQVLHCAVAENYHARLEEYRTVQDAFAYAFPDHLLVSSAVFDELGRLGQQGCFLAFHAVNGPSLAMERHSWLYVQRVKSLLQSHSCTSFPAYDYHSTSIHAALLLLTVSGERAAAKDWVSHLCRRLQVATKVRRFMPLDASFEDALEVRNGDGEEATEFSKTSTLFPVLLLWTAVLHMSDAYAFLRNEVLPSLNETTPNLWSPEAGFDELVNDPQRLQNHGVGEVLTNVPESSEDFLRGVSEELEGVESIVHAKWYIERAPFIPLIAALHWRRQLPRAMLVRQAVAFASSGPPDV